MDKNLPTPTVSGTEDSFLVVSAETDTNSDSTEDVSKNATAATSPEFYEMQIDSRVTNRYARTLVTSRVKNANPAAKEVTFSVILPDKAFISEFVMEIAGKSYKAYVKEKEEAKDIYDKAVASGMSAGHVAVSARESNRFTVSVNVEPYSKAAFLLTYEELLKRKEDMYELVVNIHPQQLVKDLSVKVVIEESMPLKFVRTTPFRSGNEISQSKADLDSRADINRVTATSCVVKFAPDVERQKQLAANLGTDANLGLSGQFVVQYDVERDPNGGEVLIQDGYFVHFFAPTEVKPLNKFIIFVLDTSGSMGGKKIVQLKQAMYTILDQLDAKDYFHIVSFESNTKVWNIQDSKTSVTTKSDYGRHNLQQDDVSLADLAFPRAFSATLDNIKCAKDVMLELNASSCTNIYEALKVALNLIERETLANENLPQPIIMFLTDGCATAGVTSQDRILSDITRCNTVKAAIFSLSFGEDADKKLLRGLSKKNRGFSRHIYEAADAALQLNNFYKEIASPLLLDVKFEYIPETTSLTITEFPIHFGGTEIIVCGRINADEFSETPKIIGTGCYGPVVYRPTVKKIVTSLERLWAYLTVQQLLDDMETAENKTVNEKKALELSLKYFFVTPVSSLVVVKPDSSNSTVNAEAANKAGGPTSFMDHNTNQAMYLRRGPAAPKFGDSVTFAGAGRMAKSVTSTGMLFGTAQSNNMSFGMPQSSNVLFGRSQSRDMSFGMPGNSGIFGMPQSISYLHPTKKPPLLLTAEANCFQLPVGPVMSLEDKFNKAAADVKNLRTQPSDEDLLELHALFQQATIGDVNTVCPDPLDLEAKAKWDAWSAKKGMSKEKAQIKYIEKVEELIASIGLQLAPNIRGDFNFV